RDRPRLPDAGARDARDAARHVRRRAGLLLLGDVSRPLHGVTRERALRRPRGHARALPWGAITHRSGTLRSPAARAPDGPVRRRFQASGAVAVRELIPSEAPATAEAVGLTLNATVVLRA